MTTTNNGAIFKTGAVVLIIDSTTYNIADTHPNYSEIMNELREDDIDWEFLAVLIDIPQSIEYFSEGLITITDDQVYYDGEELHGSMVDRMLDMQADGFNIRPLVAFLNNLMQNPSKQSIDELYLFLEACDLPITPDGYFLAYKAVRGNYMDKHSGKFDNSVGQVVEIPRNKVDDNRQHTCSAGLHFCSMEYLKEFFYSRGDRIMILKINPADVVSIPYDYNNAKGRCSKYEVVGEHHEGTDKHFYDKSVDERFSPQAELPKRDSRGRFVSNRQQQATQPRDSRGRFASW